jgi:hypothetical protein
MEISYARRSGPDHREPLRVYRGHESGSVGAIRLPW